MYKFKTGDIVEGTDYRGTMVGTVTDISRTTWGLPLYTVTSKDDDHVIYNEDELKSSLIKD